MKSNKVGEKLRKRKFAIFLFAALICILFFGVDASAAPSVDDNGDTYDDNDFAQIRTFLEAPSTISGTSNGQVLNAGYLADDPSTWTGVSWNAAGIQRVTDIDWNAYYSLNGSLELIGFEALTNVDIGANSISALDVSGDSALVSLNCAVNDITILDVSNKPLLDTLNCRSNDITDLDVSGCGALTSLNCESNDLTTLALTDNTNLETLNVTSNSLTALDVSMLSNLVTLECNSNSLSSLGLLSNGNLDWLSCSSNNLSGLDLSNNGQLTYLLCAYNPLTALDLTHNPVLEFVYADDCQLGELSTTSNPALIHLYASNNDLTEVDVSSNQLLTQLRVANNDITTVTFPLISALEYVDIQNNDLATLSTANLNSLGTLNAAYNQLTTVTVGGGSSLTVLTLSNNLLTDVDVTGNANLSTVRLNDNDLTSIDFTQNLNLDYVYLQNNSITSLDVLLNTSLDVVQALGNELRSFDMTVGGTAVSITARGLGTIEVLYNSAASSFYAVANPNATYDFDDWTNPGGTVLSTASTYNINVATEPTVFANFTAGVIFDENGGNVPADPSYSLAGPGDFIEAPTPPQYEGLTFEGWYTEPEQITLWDFVNWTVPASGILTLYAGWSGDFDVTYNGNGGSPVPAGHTVPYNTTFTEPATVPTLTGYDFGGWCTDAAATIHWDFATDRVLHDMVLYADWNPKAYTVYFDANGGVTLPYPTSRVVYYDQLVPYVTTEPEKPGYVIEGWYTDITYAVQWHFDTSRVTETTRLYPRWVAGEYTITYNSPGATTPADPASIAFAYNDYAVAPATNPTRTGYAFDAWYEEMALENEVDFGTYQVTEDADFYAGWTPNLYTVTFNRNGGVTNPIPQTMDVAYDTVIPSQPTAPTRPGYVLDAWCTDSLGTTEWNFATDHVMGDITLYARWAEAFTVTFNNNGGTTEANPQTMEVVDGHTISSAPTPPTRTGYSFSGWYIDIAGNTEWTFASDVVTGDLTLYAGWTRNNYIVTFNNNGGDTPANPETMSVPYNTTIPSQPTPPTLAGYLFEAWYKDSATTTLWDFDTDVVSGTTVLYAGYAEFFTVTFDGNGATVPPSPATMDVVENQPIGTAPTAPIWPGYQFNGWFTESSAINEWDIDNDDVTGDMTLYAGWTSVCTVTFDENGGDTAAIPNNKQTLVGETVTPPTISPTRVGHTFSGWYTTVDAVTTWNFSAGVTNNMTLYAGWNAIEYTITFDENGGDSLAVPNTMQVAYDQLISPEPTAPIRTGYLFSGWYTESSATNEWDFATDTVTENKVLYAGWTESYTVVFSNNGGDTAPVPQAMAVLGGQLISPAPIPPTRAGYTFTGWYLDSNATLAFDISTNVVTSDMILYAGWTIDTYTVTFDENGGDTAAYPTTMTVAYGDLISHEPSEPSLTGSAFAGWFTDASGTTEWDFDTDVVTGDVTLYAAYVPFVTVTFNSNGGSTEAVPSTMQIGQGLTIDDFPTPPTRTDYSFVGWFVDSAATMPWLSTDTVSGPTTLYAGWTDIMWVVRFVLSGGTTTSSIETYSVPDGSVLFVVPENPTRAGYVFEGWYHDAAGTVPWDFTTDTVTEDTVLYAVWSRALSLSVSPSVGEIYEDGRIEITPSTGGGTWTYDDTYLSASIGSTSAVFTALRAGETIVTYTVNGQTIQFTITISESELASTGQNYTLLFVLMGLSGMTGLMVLALIAAKKREVGKQRG